MGLPSFGDLLNPWAGGLYKKGTFESFPSLEFLFLLIRLIELVLPCEVKQVGKQVPVMNRSCMCTNSKQFLFN